MHANLILADRKNFGGREYFYFSKLFMETDCRKSNETSHLLPKLKNYTIEKIIIQMQEILQIKDLYCIAF